MEGHYNKFPTPEYETTTTVTRKDSEGTHTETVPDSSKPARNQTDINAWFDTNDRALENIMLRLHPTIATTVLNLLQKTIEENTDVNTIMLPSLGSISTPPTANPELPPLIKNSRRRWASSSLGKPTVRADLGGHLKYSRRWSGVRAGVLLGAQGAVCRGESRGGL